MSVLREMESVSGGRVQVLVEDTEPFTESAREAREKFGIMPREIPSVSSARTGVSDVFMGVAFTCAAEEQVIPFFDRGLPVEYELARSIRVVANTDKKRIGVISKELRIFGGLDFQTMRSSPEWSVVDELRKQYEVVQIQPNAMITEEVDGLLVVLPSTLADDEMNNVTDFIRTGVPAVLLVDPLPVVNIGLAPPSRRAPRRTPSCGRASRRRPRRGTSSPSWRTSGSRGTRRDRLGRLQPASRSGPPAAGRWCSSARGTATRRSSRTLRRRAPTPAGRAHHPGYFEPLPEPWPSSSRSSPPGTCPVSCPTPDGAAELPGIATEPQPAAPAGPDELRGGRGGAHLPARIRRGHGR